MAPAADATVLDSVPGAFQPYVRQLAFDSDGWAQVTACLWRESGDERWHAGSVDFPYGLHDADGADYVAFNLPVAPAAAQALGRALAAGDVPAHPARLSAGLGAPRPLAELVLTGEEFDEIVSRATSGPYADPCPVTAHALRRLLRDAFDGTLAP